MAITIGSLLFIIMIIVIIFIVMFGLVSTPLLISNFVFWKEKLKQEKIKTQILEENLRNEIIMEEFSKTNKKK